MKCLKNAALLLGLLLIALPAQAAETVQVLIKAGSPELTPTGIVAQEGDKFLFQAQGAMRRSEGRPFMDGWFTPSGLGSLQRSGQPFEDCPYGVLLVTWTEDIEGSAIVGDLASIDVQGSYIGHEVMLGLNMSSADLEVLDGSFQVHVTRYSAAEAQEATIILDSSSPQVQGTGISLNSGDMMLVVGMGAARRGSTPRPFSHGWFDASGLGLQRRVGQIFPDTPYGSLLGTFTTSLESGFPVGDAMSRTAPSSHYGDEFSVGLNMDADDLAVMEGHIVAHVLRIINPGLSAAGEVPGAGSIVGVQNYPNPFNPQTTIRFELATAQMVRATVVDISGRRVRDLAAREFTAGSHELQWDGRDGAGRSLASGSYFLRLQAGQAIESHKLTLVQ